MSPEERRLACVKLALQQDCATPAVMLELALAIDRFVVTGEWRRYPVTPAPAA